MNPLKSLTLASSRRFLTAALASVVVMYGPKLIGVEIPEEKAAEYAEFVVGALAFVWSALVVSMGVREHKSE
jgi:hypothetical protein